MFIDFQIFLRTWSYCWMCLLDPELPWLIHSSTSWL